MIKHMQRPTDPYSADWLLYWAANPEFARGVGAEAVAEATPTPAAAPPPAAASEAPAPVPATTSPEPAPSTTTATTTAAKDLSPEDLKLAGDILNRDWTADLPDDLKETGKRFTSKADAVRAIIDLRKRESQVRVPGKDAKPEEIAAYHKAIGIPEKPELYEFPELPEGLELNDQVKESRAQWSQRFHALGIPKQTASELSKLANEDAVRQAQAQIESDKAFATQQEAALRKEWPGEEYDRNKTLANNAFREISSRVGVNVEALAQIEMKDGRFLMDRAEIVRIFAAIGREMSEGTLGPTLTESEADSIDDQISGVRAQQQEAQASGDSKRANKLYQQEQALIGKKAGNKPVVGSRGRMV